MNIFPIPRLKKSYGKGGRQDGACYNIVDNLGGPMPP